MSPMPVTDGPQPWPRRIAEAPTRTLPLPQGLRKLRFVALAEPALLISFTLAASAALYFPLHAVCVCVCGDPRQMGLQFLAVHRFLAQK